MKMTDLIAGQAGINYHFQLFSGLPFAQDKLLEPV